MLKKGKQIVYVPGHVEVPDPLTDFDKEVLSQNPQCERGFISTDAKTTDYIAYCRYWSTHGDGRSLRTRSNSDRTPIDRLLIYNSVPQAIVDAWLTIIDYEQGE